MPRNHNPRKCSATTAAGQPCRSWATRDSDPPLCSSHAGRTGAEPGNQNARSHGFYGRAYTAQEVADLVTHAANETLDDEIGTARVALRRILELIRDERHEIEADDYARLAKLAFVGSRTVARLLRDRKALTGDAADGIADFISTALDEISGEFGIDV